MMPNFPEEKVTDTCRKCSIPQSDWEWLNGEHRESTGVGQRLRLFAEGARGDAKNMLSEERAECFLAAVSQENWYLAWREWVMKNQEQQAPIPANRLPIVRSIVNSVIYPWEKRSVQN